MGPAACRLHRTVQRRSFMLYVTRDSFRSCCGRSSSNKSDKRGKVPNSDNSHVPDVNESSSCCTPATTRYIFKVVKARNSVTMENRRSNTNLGDLTTAMSIPPVSGSSSGKYRATSSCGPFLHRAVALSWLVMLLCLAVDEQQILYPQMLPCEGIFPYLPGYTSKSTEDSPIESVTPTDIRRFVANYALIKKHLPHFYAGFTPSGDVLYFIELNHLNSSIVERGLVTTRDLEVHLQLIRQIVWDCLISLDVQPSMHIFADLRGLGAGSLGAFYSTRFVVLRHVLRSLRDKSLTKREHRVSVAVLSDSPFVRAVVEIKKHKFPPNSSVRVYSSLADFFTYHADGTLTPEMIPKRYGGTADVTLEKEGFEFLIKLFVEEILSRNHGAIEECAAAAAPSPPVNTKLQQSTSVSTTSRRGNVRKSD